MDSESNGLGHFTTCSIKNCTDALKRQILPRKDKSTPIQKHPPKRNNPKQLITDKVSTNATENSDCTD